MARVDAELERYTLDSAVKELLGFTDKLTNRYLRRSRRRFRAEGMTEDKQSAYMTLYTVLWRYCQLAAPFAPFITEWVWQELQSFTGEHTQPSSIHLQ